MPYLFKSATFITLDPAAVGRADLRIEGGRVAERAAQLEPRAGEEVIDLSGKIIMPGMVCAHTHLYSALARGMPAPPRLPANFKEILELIWWRLDRALDEETIYWSALVGALEAARAGTTCLFDHHASPSHITRSLQIVRAAMEKVGLRGVLCYEVTNRGGRRRRDAGLEENRAFLAWAGQSPAPAPADRSQQDTAMHEIPATFRGMVGAHASFTLSDASLEVCAELMREFDVGLHIHVAEDLIDVEDARARYDSGVIERLAKRGALNGRTILAHGTHLGDRDIEIAREAGAWFAHNPRSNMNNQVGYAPLAKFSDKILLGTDGIGADMFEEARFAFFKSREMRLGWGADEWRRVLAANQRLASGVFGLELGSLDSGSVADLIVLDYAAPTPLVAENLAWHLIFGMNSAAVESVMVNGQFVIRQRRSVLDDEDLYSAARQASERLWAKLREM
jgi:putative selenium metabolism protein SsnA